MSRRPPTFALLAAGAVLAGGAFLRLAAFDLVPFKIDGVTAILTTRFWFGHGLPQFGQMSGTGVIMPPGFIYVLYPLVRLTSSALAVTLYVAVFNIAALVPIYLLGREAGGRRAGFWAAALAAFHPWLIFYSRTIWPQCVFPFFSAWFLLVVVRCTRVPRSRGIFWAGPLLSLIWQIHYSGYSVLAFFLFWFAVAAVRRRVRWPSALAGFLAGLFLLVPHLFFLFRSGFAPLRQTFGGRIGAAAPFPANFAEIAVSWWNNLFAGGLGWNFQSGQFGMAPLRGTPLGLERGWLEPLGLAATFLVFVLFLAGVALQRSGRTPALPLDRDPVAWLALMAVIPLLVYPLRGIRIPPWSFLAGLPAALAVAGRGLAALGGSIRNRKPWPALPALVGVPIVISGAAIHLAFLAHVGERGGTGGMYGLTYRVQEAAAERLIGEGIALDRIDAGLTDGAGFSIFYLHDYLAGRLPARPPLTARRARLIDRLRFPGWNCIPGEESPLSAPGPVLICVSPE